MYCMMKKKIMIPAMLTICALLLVSCAANLETKDDAGYGKNNRQSAQETVDAFDAGDVSVGNSGYGSSGALTDFDLRLTDMLTYALQDEYLAHAEYVYILDEYGKVNPFSNIIKAEETHISQLLPLFEQYDIDVPKDDAKEYVASVNSLTEAYKAGEQAEINNIAMYNEFLKQNLPDDVRTVFESLRNASENHLAAFRNHL